MSEFYRKYKIAFFSYPLVFFSTLFIYYGLNSTSTKVIESNHEKSEQESKAISLQIRDVINHSFDSKLSLAKTLVSFVKMNPSLEESEFNDFTRYLFESSKNDLISIQLVKDSIITYNYPILGNEATKGVNIFDVSNDRSFVSEAYNSKSAMSVGPRILLQKKLGIAFREPIILEDKNQTLWGYAVVVLDVNKSFLQIPIIANNAKKLSIYSAKKGLEKEGLFFGDSEIKNKKNIKTISKVPLDSWTIYYDASIEDEFNPISDFALKCLYLIIAFLISISIALVIKSAIDTVKKNKILKEQNHLIQKQLEEKNILIGEIHHRIKNHFQMLTSLNRILYLDIEDDRVQKIISEINSRVNSMASVYDQLRVSEKSSLSLNNYIKTLTENLINTLNSGIKVKIEIENQTLDVKRTINLGVILTEILTNSLKHAFLNKKNGQIKISIKSEGNCFVLKALDNGLLLPKEVLTTEHQSQGIELIKLISHQIDADLSIYRDSEWNGFQLKFKSD